MPDALGPNFEDNITIIDGEIAKRRGLWNLSSIQWMDFDDVSQIIRIHIYEKWALYDQTKPLVPWLNKVISHQIKNIVRNIYGNYVRPCLRCAAAEPDNLCKIYGSQCSKCPLYAAWEKSKKQAYEVKIPVPIENHLNDSQCSWFDTGYTDSQEIDKQAAAIHARMQKTLKPVEWTVYELLFIKNLSEDEVAAKMGYKTSESGRRPGYKHIKNLRKIIMEKVKKALRNDEVDIL
jgi:DNA-directed RNA polymerase specialized sigma24 family protein